MIAAKDTSIEQLGALQGEAKAMGIAADATAHIMDILSKGLYKNPRAAVIREYSTNAFDAQVEAGVTRPIEVTLPNNLGQSLLTIRDYGVGLTEADIESIYSQYGASTKRASNDFNGMLGLGCKSAFSYGNRFIVVSHKDGERIEVVVTRSEDGSGEMVVANRRPTDEPNGTTVKVPAKPGDDFKRQAADFFYWWKPGTVLVNGKQPEHFDPTADGVMEIAQGVYVVKNREEDLGYRTRPIRVDNDFVVMGNVAYPHLFDTGLDHSTHHLVVQVPIGAVSFTPSREALQLNPPTRDAVAKIESDFKTALIKTFQGAIDSAGSKADALTVVANWKAIIPANVKPASGWQYKGEVIPTTFTLDPPDPSGTGKLYSARPNMRLLPFERRGYHNSHEKKRSVGIAHMGDNAIWVEGFTAEKVSAAQAQKARKWAEENKIKAPNGFVFVDSIDSAIRPWLSHVVQYDVIKRVKLPRTHNAGNTASGRIPGSYDLYTTDPKAPLPPSLHGRRRNGVPADEFKNWKTPLFFYVGNVYDATYVEAALGRVQGAKGYTMVCLRRDRVEKFLRNFPNATKAVDAISAGFDAWLKSLPADKLLALAVQGSYYHNSLGALDPSQIADPELAKYVRLCNMDVKDIDAANRTFSTVLGLRTKLPKLTDWNRRYPLMNTHYKTHTYAYIKAVHTARQKGESL